MTRFSWLLGGSLLASLLAGAASGQGGRPADLDTAAGRSIVVLTEAAGDPGEASAGLARRYGFHVRGVYRSAFPGFSATLSERAREGLARDPRVESIHPDRGTFRISAQTVPAGIARIGATAVHAVGATGAGVRLAVVDTGIDLDHPDLAANVDRGLSRSFVSFWSSPPGGDDDHGHGTHVAGTGGAADNDRDVVGVAPDVSLVSLKVLSWFGSGFESDIVAALDYVTSHNQAQSDYAGVIHVVNMSLGGPGDDSNSPMHRAVRACVRSGTTFCVAAGNDGDDAAGYEPASYDEVITVSALDGSDRLASFSNHGADVDLAAPGVGVLSTRLGGGTTTFSGTSMASPHAAGAAAQFIAANLGALSAMWSADRASVAPYVQAQLVAAGECPDGSHAGPCAEVWPGDPDGIGEPLVDVDQAVGLPAGPAVRVAVSTDRSTYDPRIHAAVGLTVRVSNEAGDPIAGLGAGAFATALDGAAIGVAYVETSPGTYEGAIDLPAPGPHAVDVEATDGRGISGAGRATFGVLDPSTTTIHVGAYAYDQKGKTLYIHVRIDDAAGDPVEGVAVDVEVLLDGAFYGSGTGAITGADGVASYRGRNAPDGLYTTRATRVEKAGAVHDPSLDAEDPGYLKR